MKIIGYIIIISILLNLLVQFGLILRYYYPIIQQYFKNEKITWNSNYDRVIAGAFIGLFYLALLLSRTLLTSSNELYLAIPYMTILILLTISIFLIYRMGFKERMKNNLIYPKEPTIKKFNHLLNENQLSYLYNEFKKNDFINDDFNQNDFCSKFLNEKIKLAKKITNVNLWHIHNHLIENIEIDKNLDLKTFVSFFTTYKNDEFTYGSVKNGSQIKYTKSVETIETIFRNIPK